MKASISKEWETNGKTISIFVEKLRGDTWNDIERIVEELEIKLLEILEEINRS